MAQWKTFDVDIPPNAVNQAAETLSGFIETLSSFVETVVQLLKSLKVFLIQFPNPLLAALKAVIQIIENILSNLRETGLYWLSVLPDSLEEMENYKGGYDEFERILVNSLYDQEDPNRPQFGSNAYMGGAVFNFTVTGGDGSSFLEKILQLYWLLNRRTDLRFPPPVNIQAQPADDLGQAEGSFTETALSVFTADNQRQLSTVRLTWEEPKGEGSFLNIFQNSKFYIEQSEDTSRRTPQRERGELETSPKDKEQDSPPTEPLKDRQGKDITVWEPVDPSDPFIDAASFGNTANPNLFLGPIAGTYGTIIEDIDPGVDNGRFFRVRSVPQDVALEEVEVDTDSDDSTENPTKHKLVWGNGEPYMKSQPSRAVYGFVPGVDTSFDLPSALLNVYRAAYLLRFDREVRDSSDNIVVGSNTLDRIVPPPLETLEGVGISGGGLTINTPSTAGSMGTIPTLSSALFPEEIDDWDDTQQRESVKKIKDLPTDVLEVGDNLIGRFKTKPFDGSSSFHADIYGTTPEERWRNFIDRVASERIRRILPEMIANEELAAEIRSDYQSISSDIEGALTGGIESRFDDENFRTSIKHLVGLSEISLTRGQPPNWETIQFFPELLPELDDILSRAFSLVKSIEKALSSIVEAFTDALDAIIARLKLITSLLDTIDEALDFLETFSDTLFSLNFLFVPPDTGGTSGFISRIRSAGNKPDSDPEDFAGGFCFAFGAPSTQGFQQVGNAFSFLFQ